MAMERKKDRVQGKPFHSDMAFRNFHLFKYYGNKEEISLKRGMLGFKAATAEPLERLLSRQKWDLYPGHLHSNPAP